MTTKRIIYINDGGGVSVVIPAPEYVEQYGIEAVAKKDVPAGRPYKIIDASGLPDRSQRNAWVVDPALLTDGVGGV